MNTKAISISLILGVIISVSAYATFIIYITWPISELSANKAGVFGDSFGILTSLFSGLAFSGMIITILLQREELQLQRKELTENRKEFAKSANAQERNAQLTALTTLLTEYKSQIAINETQIEKDKFNTHLFRGKRKSPIEAENLDLIRRKGIIIYKIEEILQGTGVEFKKT